MSRNGSSCPSDGSVRFSSARNSSRRSTAEKRSTASSVVTGTFMVYQKPLRYRPEPVDNHASRDPTMIPDRAQIQRRSRKRCPPKYRERYLMEDLVFRNPTFSKSSWSDFKREPA